MSRVRQEGGRRGGGRDISPWILQWVMAAGSYESGQKDMSEWKVYRRARMRSTVAGRPTISSVGSHDCLKYLRSTFSGQIRAGRLHTQQKRRPRDHTRRRPRPILTDRPHSLRSPLVVAASRRRSYMQHLPYRWRHGRRLLVLGMSPTPANRGFFLTVENTQATSQHVPLDSQNACARRRSLAQ